MKKVLSIVLISSFAAFMLTSCDSGKETVTTTSSSEALATSLESSSDETEASVVETKLGNVNNLPVYEEPALFEYESKLDMEVTDEMMESLLEVGKYPFRTSYGFGFDSKFTTDYITEYVNTNYGTSYDILTIDDLNYYNTNHYYIKPELFDADSVNRLIWFSFYSGSLDCDYDCFMLNRAILLSLDLVPMVDEIPADYIRKYVVDPETLSVEDVDRIMDDYLLNRSEGLTDDERRIAEVIKYNISFHDIMNWRYNVSLGRRANGNIFMALSPSTIRYQGIIDGCSSMNVYLNTEMQFDMAANKEVRVIVKDTPEFFEETFGRTYESVLEEYGLPVNPTI